MSLTTQEIKEDVREQEARMSEVRETGRLWRNEPIKVESTSKVLGTFETLHGPPLERPDGGKPSKEE